MNLKQVCAGMGLLTCLATAHAQSAGSFYITSGWFHIAPQSSSDPLKILSVGGTPVNQAATGTAASIDSSDTLGLSFGYFITDHLSAEFEAGIPSKFNLDGGGTLTKYGKLGDARQWSPALLFKWNFLSAQSKFRPYAGLGVTRIWFTDAQITNRQFEADVLHGPTTVSTDRSWAPIFNLGFNYALTKHWFAGFSISYIPVGMTTTLSTEAQTPVGTLTVRSEAKVRLDPIVTYARIGYVF